jgi:hypothetical protein
MLIFTKFLGPTDHRGARIKADCGFCKIIVPYRYELHSFGNHADAARQLLIKARIQNTVGPFHPYSYDTGYIFMTSYIGPIDLNLEWPSPGSEPDVEELEP